MQYREKRSLNDPRSHWVHFIRHLSTACTQKMKYGDELIPVTGGTKYRGSGFITDSCRESIGSFCQTSTLHKLSLG